MKIIKALFLALTLLNIGSAFANENQSCRSFEIETGVMGYITTYTKVCDGGEANFIMKVTYKGKSVAVDSRVLSSPEVDVAKAIEGRMVNGLSNKDSAILVNEIAPALESGDRETAFFALIDLILN